MVSVAHKAARFGMLRAGRVASLAILNPRHEQVARLRAGQSLHMATRTGEAAMRIVIEFRVWQPSRHDLRWGYVRKRSPLHDGAAIQFEERAGNAREHRQPVKFLRRQALRVTARGNGRAHHAFVGQSAVGHETMHSPQDMHVESPIGEFRSNAMPAE